MSLPQSYLSREARRQGNSSPLPTELGRRDRQKLAPRLLLAQETVQEMIQSVSVVCCCAAVCVTRTLTPRVCDSISVVHQRPRLSDVCALPQEPTESNSTGKQRQSALCYGSCNRHSPFVRAVVSAKRARGPHSATSRRSFSAWQVSFGQGRSLSTAACNSSLV